MKRLNAATPRCGRLLLRYATALLASAFVAGCSPSLDPDANQAFSAAPGQSSQLAATAAGVPEGNGVAQDNADARPAEVAAAPAAPQTASSAPQPAAPTAAPQPAQRPASAQTASRNPEETAPTTATTAPAADAPARPATPPSVVTQADAPPSVDEAQPAAAQAKPQTGLLAGLFGANKARSPAPASGGQGEFTVASAAPRQAAAATPRQTAQVSSARQPVATAAREAAETPQLNFENIAPVGQKAGRATQRRNQPPDIRAVRASAFADDGEGSGLPGVRQSALFDIKRKSGMNDDDSDVDVHEYSDGVGQIDVATAAGLARLSPNGLLKQRDSVDTACLKPSLVKLLKDIERRFGKRVVVTSGYRSPGYNRKVRGAKNSQHMYCAAADIQVPGVSRWELANFARSMPNRGGVGTYCHTASVHVDVGPERDWNWRCRGRRS